MLIQGFPININKVHDKHIWVHQFSLRKEDSGEQEVLNLMDYS